MIHIYAFSSALPYFIYLFSTFLIVKSELIFKQKNLLAFLFLRSCCCGRFLGRNLSKRQFATKENLYMVDNMVENGRHKHFVYGEMVCLFQVLTPLSRHSERFQKSVEQVAVKLKSEIKF